MFDLIAGPTDSALLNPDFIMGGVGGSESTPDPEGVSSWWDQFKTSPARALTELFGETRIVGQGFEVQTASGELTVRTGQGVEQQRTVPELLKSVPGWVWVAGGTGIALAVFLRR